MKTEQVHPFGMNLFLKNRRRPTLTPLVGIPSALRGLTSLFGMGRGGHPRHNRHKTVDTRGVRNDLTCVRRIFPHKENAN